MNAWMIVKNLVKLFLAEKEDFCRHLNMEDITDADYMHAKRVCKDFKIKNSAIHYCYLMYLKTFEICLEI